MTANDPKRTFALGHRLGITNLALFNLIAMRFAVSLLFTAAYAVEGIFLFGAAIHGWTWFAPLSVLFVIVATVHIWFVAWRHAPDRAPLKKVFGIGAAIGLVPFAIFFTVALALTH